MNDSPSDPGEPPHAGERRAIVMLSVGERPWAAASSETFRHYAEDVGADVHVVRSLPSSEELPLPDLPDKPGRRNKRAYACKTFYAWQFMAERGYDRVLFVDDTCAVRPGTPDMFALVPPAAVGFTRTSTVHAQRSFACIERFVADHGLAPVELVAKAYANSGVLVYGRPMADAIAPGRVCEAADLLYADFPHQTLTYYLLRSAGVRVRRLLKTFNTVPATRLPAEERRNIVDMVPHLDDAVHIHHITSANKRRDIVVEQVAAYCLAEWRSGGRGRGPGSR